ncbi:peptidoglycan recognition protein family protein [Amantichitinum ursilacus]|uniref:N-acetylmuramoyl-L-alanine amidase n=1 Tax=Amantichitinum ursilacus TaxID=857265 RepID=A0A0N1JS52_9NEIS|nr:peptidoglycan recognition family protein [Amantichitinum ursilacus]KPC50287.1 N-acetylmuramoyl-L-alanine amidase [Amantichitinum ursilacus]
MSDLKIKTVAKATTDYLLSPPLEITVNDRAATRDAIIKQLNRNGCNFITRSDWAAHKNKSEKMKDDWNYKNIAIHHAGRSYACGPGALQLQEIQRFQMDKSINSMDDIGYHYAVDCSGNIFEGRDIRFKGEHVHNYNTGVIGIVLLQNMSTPEEGGDSISRLRVFLKKMGYKDNIEIPENQRKALSMLIDVLSTFFHISVLGGHREFPRQLGEGKICPGNAGLSLIKSLRKSKGLAAPQS